MLDGEALARRYLRNRERSRALFDLLSDEAYYAQPISLRHPIVFYEGHLPAFSFNTLVKKALDGPAIDERLESLFARGIDPSEPDGRAFEWPDRMKVRQFASEADRRVVEALRHADLDRPDNPLLRRGEAAFTILEHEAMHQETLLYIWQRLPLAQKCRPAGYRPLIGGAVPAQEWIDVPAGPAALGVERDGVPFAWDNELPSCAVEVPAFRIERHDVTNAAFQDFIDAGGYQDERWWRPADWAWIRTERVEHPVFWQRAGGDGREWLWRGMFDIVSLPPEWPVYVSQAEAHAYATWRRARLPTEAEFHRAAYGSPDGRYRSYPWGFAPPDRSRGVFDFESWDPEPAGSHPCGRSAWGIDDLVGNGWEWTSTVFRPFPGFRAMASYPEYSADFFDGDHVVMKGASPATAHELLRPSFRNWFRTRYPYMYATFRCAKDIE